MTTWTILNLLNWTTEYFTKAGLSSPRLDAEILLAHSLKLKRMDLYLQFDRPLLSDELAAYKMLIKRRIEREPIAYIIGEKEFWSRSFKVGPGVLIPRPETELIVEIVTRDSCLVSREKPITILDIGTGSGILAITLAKEFPNTQVMAIDISPEALSYAKENAERHSVADRIQFLEQDFLTSHESLVTSHFDLIVSNPPYIASAEIETLDDDVRKFEPQLALDGDSDGLKFYRALSEKAFSLLNSQGTLVMEIGEDQGLAVGGLAVGGPAVGGLFSKDPWMDAKVIKDYAGHDRVVIVKRA